MSEILNTHVQHSIELLVITGSLPKKIHKFYEKFLFNMQSLETLGKLKEISGYVRMFINKLQGVKGNLVRTDDN